MLLLILSLSSDAASVRDGVGTTLPTTSGDRLDGISTEEVEAAHRGGSITDDVGTIVITSVLIIAPRAGARPSKARGRSCRN